MTGRARRLLPIAIITAALTLSIMFFDDQKAARQAELQAEQACVASGGDWEVYGVIHSKASCRRPRHHGLF